MEYIAKSYLSITHYLTGQVKRQIFEYLISIVILGRVDQSVIPHTYARLFHFIS